VATGYEEEGLGICVNGRARVDSPRVDAATTHCARLKDGLSLARAGAVRGGGVAGSTRRRGSFARGVAIACSLFEHLPVLHRICVELAGPRVLRAPERWRSAQAEFRTLDAIRSEVRAGTTTRVLRVEVCCRIG